MPEQMTSVAAILQFPENVPKFQRRRRGASGSPNNHNGGLLLVLFLLLLQQVTSSQSPDACTHHSRSQEDSKLLESFSQLLDQLQPLENLFDLVCAGNKEAWQTVHEELVAVNNLARSIQERIPRGNSGRQVLIQGKPVNVGTSIIKPIPVSASLNPFGASVSLGSNKPNAGECRKLTPKIKMKYINLVRSNGLLLGIEAGIDGCEDTIHREVDTDLMCQCSTSSTTSTTMTISPNATDETASETVANITTISIATSSEGTTVIDTTTTSTEGTTSNVTTPSTQGTSVSGTKTTSTEGTTVNATTSTEGTAISSVTTVNGTISINGTSTTSTEGTTISIITINEPTLSESPTLSDTTTSTKWKPINGTTTTSTEGPSVSSIAINVTTTTSPKSTIVSSTTAFTTTTSIEGTTVSGPSTNGTTTTSTEGTTVSGPSTNGTTTTSTEGTTVSGPTTNGTTTTSTEGTTVSVPSTNGTTTSTEGTTINVTTITSTESTRNATCITASANITAEIQLLNRLMSDIQYQIQGVTQALIECTMDKNALEKAKVLTQTLNELIQRLQGILQRLQNLQGQPQARLIPGFLTNFNVPTLRGVYVDQGEVNCLEEDSSFPESFATIDAALGSLAEDPTNTSKADHLYCSASHMVDTTSQVMRDPRVRQGNLFEEAIDVTRTKSKIDKVLKMVAQEEKVNENRRESLEKELSELNLQFKDIENKLIEANGELEEQDNEV